MQLSFMCTKKTVAFSMVYVANKFVERSIHGNDIFVKFTEVGRRNDSTSKVISCKCEYCAVLNVNIFLTSFVLWYMYKEKGIPLLFRKWLLIYSMIYEVSLPLRKTPINLKNTVYKVKNPRRLLFCLKICPSVFSLI